MKVSFVKRSERTGPSFVLNRLAEHLNVETEMVPSNSEASGDIVHVNGLGPEILGAEKPVVVTYHGTLHWYEPSLLNMDRKYANAIYQRIMDVFLSRSADFIVTVSDYTRSVLSEKAKVPEKKMETVHNGVSRDFDKGGAKLRLPDNYFLHVSNRGQRRKNTARVIRAFREIDEGNLNLIVVGEGQDFSEGDVEGLGFVPKEWLPTLYSNALGLVNPSILEGFGMCYVEAMKCGCPVIGANNTAIPEVVGEAGLLVEDARSVGRIKDCMERLLKNPKLRRRLGKEGRNRAEKFTWEKSAKRLEEIYRGVLGA